jgi:geranylgeranyl pyrophosphate synthase
MNPSASNRIASGSGVPHFAAPDRSGSGFGETNATGRPALEQLFCERFQEWVEIDSSGPRSAALEAAWKCAVLAPARCVLGEAGKQFRARLTRVSWGLAGGNLAQLPEVLPLVVEALHAGSLVVDDVQDGSETRRGQPTLHRLVGAPLAINTGNLLYCWALELLGELGLPPAVELRLHRAVAHAMLRCHQGQGLDLSVRICETPQHLVPSLVQTSTSLKAGTLLQLAARLGAVGAQGTDERVAALADFGSELGVALQMLDDLSGVLNPERRHKAAEDLRLQRPTWNWAWLARDLEREEFVELQTRARRAESDGVDDVLDAIAARVGGAGKDRVHTHLALALRALRASCGDPPLLKLLEAEIERLESCYV